MKDSSQLLLKGIDSASQASHGHVEPSSRASEASATGYVHISKSSCLGTGRVRRAELVPYVEVSRSRRVFYARPWLEIAAQLRALGLPVRLCCLEARKVFCRHGHENHIPYFCKDMIHCPICARRLAVMEGNRLYHRLRATGARYVVQVVFTFPHDSRWASEDKAERGREAFAVVQSFLRSHGWSGVAVLHTWGTENPLGTVHFHVHVLVPSSEHWFDVEGLRQEWRQTLSEAALEPPERVNVHVNYVEVEDEARLRDLCIYVSRRAIIDINVQLLKLGAGVPWSLWHYQFHVSWPANFHRIRWYGKLSNGLVSSTLASQLNLSGEASKRARRAVMAELHEALRREAVEGQRWFCWACHVELVQTLGERVPLRTELLAVRRVVWKRYGGW
jgi:hypothetical protein